VVLVMGKDGKPEARLVVTGLSDGRNTQIMSGLQDGDQIITQVIAAGKQPTQAARGGGGGIFPGGGGGARPGGGR
jgi:HlyD family secretion protein